jgi:molybdopterin synthase sulfur carrier subunit
MPTVRIPAPLRRLTAGQPEVRVDGQDVDAVIRALDVRHPGIRERLLDEGRLRPYVHVFVDDEDVRSGAGLATAVSAETVVTIVPAVAGG